MRARQVAIDRRAIGTSRGGRPTFGPIRAERSRSVHASPFEQDVWDAGTFPGSIRPRVADVRHGRPECWLASTNEPARMVDQSADRSTMRFTLMCEMPHSAAISRAGARLQAGRRGLALAEPAFSGCSEEASLFASTLSIDPSAHIPARKRL
jgi:hypothetical protein